ncbi:MAG: hypothetical protein IJ689_04040, partial [Alphaproteobacteria bacterium]|nr:hypothetical protein [Alphaproteobacteria bacterium]
DEKSLWGVDTSRITSEKDVKLLSALLWLEGVEIRLAKYRTLFYATVSNFQSPRLYVGVIFFVNNR